MSIEWFTNWFDSPYYHTLYKYRNAQEAEAFIAKLLDRLQLAKNSYLLDLACGKGRHSISINNNGYKVLGLDLSQQSIAYAKKFESKNLEFAEHDMRQNFGQNRFEGVFNLFTSFGYFDVVNDNLRILKNVYDALKPGGIFVLDYLNADVISNSIEIKEETKTYDDIVFKLRKYVEGDFIIKDIEVFDNGELFNFKEQVQLFTKEDLLQLFNKAGLKVKSVFGDYQFNDFQPSTSNRLILVASKEN